MKFAKELDENAIPEWKDKYFDYKGAKKKLKAVDKAVKTFDRSSPLARRPPFGNATSIRDGPIYSFLNRGRGMQAVNPTKPNGQIRSETASPQGRSGADQQQTPRPRPFPPLNETSPLRLNNDADAPPRMTRYGSIIGSPPSGNSPMAELTPQKSTQVSMLELPDPALNPLHGHDHPSRVIRQDTNQSQDRTLPGQDSIGNMRDFPTSLFRNHSSSLAPRRTLSVPDVVRPAFLKRVMSIASGSQTQGRSSAHSSKNNEIALGAYREMDFKQAEFFSFLDKQLTKIEEFYKMKEDEALDRLTVLREQLHVLRNRRLEDITAAEQRHKHNGHQPSQGHLSFAPERLSLSNWNFDGGSVNPSNEGDEDGNGMLEASKTHTHHHRWTSVTSQVDDAIDKVRTGHVGKTSKAMEELGTPTGLRLNPDNQDYVRRHPKETIPPYRVAKRKLKTALQEFYRGLELLKSYTLLNRTAFRKINKKYDKTVQTPSGSTMRYMSDRVNKAHFVNSDHIDATLQTVEDLYARYFERGNRKVAIGKLRGKTLKIGDYTGSLCRTGFFLGCGLVLGIQGLVYGCEDLFSPDTIFRIRSSYLLQIYAGYFLFLLLVAFFCIDARIFSRGKVNYQFVFEFDSRHVLNWRQLAEIPSVFFFLLSLTMFLNFTVRAGGNDMYIYWPVVLIGLSTILLFLPPPLFYWDARRWFLYSMWRLLFAGLYPVEFRDFFLGDMFCSQTYAMGNIELFFCLYATSWDRPPICNSSNSRLLGFFSTLPGIWRALQCVRRYYDTRNVFPHLVNCGKYTFTILTYMSLSLFRINKTDHLKGLFIAIATINAIYCSFWDILMDWSLGDLGAKHRLLRNVLAFKKHVWFYYVAMILDPILRFNWVFYAIFADDIQHSSIISFAVAASEVCRRGLWTIIRVENEHCTNVSRNRVVRDVELPYQRMSDETLSITQFDGASATSQEQASRPSDVETGWGVGNTTATEQRPNAATPASDSFLRQRKQAAAQADSPVAQVLKRVGNTIASAHSQDYERKRQPTQHSQEDQDSDEDEEEDIDVAATQTAESLVDRAR